MKKPRIIFVILLSFTIFTGCKQINTSINKTPASNTQVNNPTKLNEQNNISLAENPSKSIYQLQDDKFYLDHYIYGLDISMIGKNELIFRDAKKIKPESLDIFFEYIVYHEKLYDYESWYNKTDKMYHVPISIIKQTLPKYLDVGDTIDLSLCYGYNKDSNEIVNTVFAGYGGERFVKLEEKQQLGNNIIRLKAAFYDDETYLDLVYEKVYTIEINPSDTKTYKYLSIIKYINKDGKMVELTSPE